MQTGMENNSENEFITEFDATFKSLSEPPGTCVLLNLTGRAKWLSGYLGIQPGRIRCILDESMVLI